jgi:uncharacterized damage-inducible protein DinB
MEFQSRGVLALVRLHEREMGSMLDVWKEARQRSVRLPETEDPDYESLDHVTRHVLRAARGYLNWMCDVLERPAPEIPSAPEAEDVLAEADAYLGMILAAWREHLAWMPDDVAGSANTYKSRWGMPYTIEEMLEHAVVHPMRHRIQLEGLLGRSADP